MRRYSNKKTSSMITANSREQFPFLLPPFLRLAAMLLFVLFWLQNGLSTVSAQVGNQQAVPFAMQSVPENTASAQPVPVIPALAETAIPPLQQAPLDAVILFNPAGKRSVVLPGGWTLDVLDEFSRFLVKEQQEPVLPFTIQSITANGNVVQNRAETTVRFVITTTGSQAVRIPLGMKEGILPFADSNSNDSNSDKGGKNDKNGQGQLPVRYSGAGSFQLITSPEDGQFSVLIRPPLFSSAEESTAKEKKIEKDEKNTAEKSTKEKQSGGNTDGKNIETTTSQPDSVPSAISGIPNLTDITETKSRSDDKTVSRHELTVNFWFPLTKTSNEEQMLAVSFPPAVSSQFVLNVPAKGLSAAVSPGALLEVQETGEAKHTRFNVFGLKPNFQITWGKTKKETVVSKTVLRVEDASIIASLENRSVNYDVTLPVRCSIGSFDILRIRMPSNTVLDQQETERLSTGNNYSLRLLPKEDWANWQLPSNNETDSLSPILEVQFAKQMSGPVKIILKAMQNVKETGAIGQWSSLGSFDVIGAERQSGYLSVGVPAGMRAYWKPVRNIRRTELSGAMTQDGINARFEFFSQSFLLQYQLISPQTRINVKPEYQVQINKGSLALTAKWAFFIHGVKTEKLDIQLYDWQWSGGNITPVNIIDTEGAEQKKNGLLSVPLRVPTEGEFTVELKAHRTITQQELDDGKISIRIPKPQADWLEPATPFVVVPADNIEINPVQTAGLTRRSRRSLPINIEIPHRQLEPLFYQTESPDAVFTAEIQYRSLQIKTDIQTDIQILASEEQITEVVNYDVSYEPVERLYFDIPSTLANRNIRAACNGKLLELQNVPTSPDSNASETGVKKRISLPETAIGNFQVVFTYSIPSVVLDDDTVSTAVIPFILPSQTNQNVQSANIFAQQGVKVELHSHDSEQWRAGNNPAGSKGIPIASFTTTSFQKELPLFISLAGKDALGKTIVERDWIQTYLADGLRIDQCSSQIISDDNEIMLQLPAAVNKSRIIVKYNKVRIPVQLSAKSEITIPVQQKNKPFLLEVWYEVHTELQHTLQLELPQFDSDTLVRCLYWQLILPQSIHIIDTPNDWTPEYRWKWTGWFWGRVPSVKQQEIGWTVQIPEEIHSAQANQYVFSSLNPQRYVVIHLAQRSLIVLLCSSLSLLIGLIIIYFPQSRYAGSLFGIAVAFTGLFFYQPAPILLALQASFFGVAAALAARYIYRIIYREKKWIIPSATDWKDVSPQQEVYSVIVDSDSKQNSEKQNFSSELPQTAADIPEEH
ncbi:hypothetical protein FACS189427_10690 [Planctomycetales bacterium]|nr:hypothetical protein FACS189427_10690 [Planctomycetales bacterium]